MKNWLRRKMHNFIFPQDEAPQSNKVARQSIGITTDGETLSTEPLRLSIYRANGGMIVETRVYDRQKDRSQNQLHIVSHDEDLGHSIAKIITMESLRG
jgi:hypothetical protein